MAASKTQEAMSDALDRALLKAVRNEHRKAKANEPVSAALLNSARARLHDLGVTKVIAPGDTEDQLASEMGLDAHDYAPIRIPPMRGDKPDADEKVG